MDDTSPLGWGRPGPESGGAAPSGPAGDVWPIEPDPAVTSLAGRQLWRFSDGRPVAAEVGGVRIAAGDARIAHLGIRRDPAGLPFPAAFTHSPMTGAPLPLPGSASAPDILDVDPESAVEIPLPSGVPTLVEAGRPAGLYLFQDNLGAVEAWNGRSFTTIGRLPPAVPQAGSLGPALAAGPHGIACTTQTSLVTVPLPQLGPDPARVAATADGLRFLSAPCWADGDAIALAERDGRLVLCRLAAGAEGIAVRDLGHATTGGRFAGPWTNRLGDAFWTGAEGFVACPAGAGAAAFVPWPGGFSPIPSLAPWRDRAGLHHQIGMADGRYHYAALSAGPALHRLDGPHLAAGGVSYCGAERFDLPWQAPAETLNLGTHTGSLLVPLLAMARDTVLLALDIAGPRGGFLRGERLPAPLAGYVLHHAHGVGLRRLPVGLTVSGLHDAGALLHGRALYLWSRTERRCHSLRLRAA